MLGHTGLKHVSLGAAHPLPWVNALRSLLPLSLLYDFFPPFGHRQRSLSKLLINLCNWVCFPKHVSVLSEGLAKNIIPILL